MSLDVFRAGLTKLQTLEAYTSNILQKHTSTHRGTDTHTHTTHTHNCSHTHTHTLGEGGATIPSMKKSSPKLSGGQKLSHESVGEESSPTLSRGPNSLGDVAGAAKSQHTVEHSLR